MDWAYEKAVDGAPGLDSARDLANNYLASDKNLIKQVESLIRSQKRKTARHGILTGLGGIVTIPHTITSVIFIQVRMIAAIAHMGGYDLQDDHVKTLVKRCLITNMVTKRVFNRVKFVPLIGVLIGSTVDAIVTNTIGYSAKNTFIKTNTHSKKRR